MPSIKRRKKEIQHPAENEIGELHVSQDDKRLLIQAHSAMRAAKQSHDPIQVMSMWAGVIVVTLAIAVGWWWSVSPIIAGNFSIHNIRQDVGAVFSGVKNK